MKVFISADIEGVTVVTHDDEGDVHKPESAQFREQMTAEVAAACEGALAAGASEVWVKDAHATGRNLLATKLPREIKLIRGWSGHPLSMVEHLDGSFAAVVMVGYHARAGLAANPLAHTMSGKVASVRINERFASEFLLHAYAASSVGVPVAFVSGDEGVCDEATSINPCIGVVAVKRGVGGSTVNLHPTVAIERIKAGVERALRRDLTSCRIVLPDRFRLELRFRSHERAYRASFYPGASLTDDLTITLEVPTYLDVLRALLFVV